MTNFAKKKASVLDVLNMLSAAAHMGCDGCTDEKGERIDVGLSRDEEVEIRDKRIMDGFGVKFLGDKLIVSYQAEMLLSDVKDQDLEQEVKSKLNKVATFLRKEYKKLAGKALTLTMVEDSTKVDVQMVSRVRTVVTGTCMFKIGGLTNVLPYDENEDALRPEVEKFLGIGKDKFPGSKKGAEDTRKKLNERRREPKMKDYATGTLMYGSVIEKYAREFLNDMSGEYGHQHPFKTGSDALKHFKKTLPPGLDKSTVNRYKRDFLASFDRLLSRRRQLAERKKGNASEPQLAKPSRATLYRQLDKYVEDYMQANVKTQSGQRPMLGGLIGKKEEIGKKLADRIPGLLDYALKVTTREGYFAAVERSIKNAIENWGNYRQRTMRKKVVEPKRRSTTLRRGGMTLKEWKEQIAKMAEGEG